jgi:hypothetical protein
MQSHLRAIIFLGAGAIAACGGSESNSDTTDDAALSVAQSDFAVRPDLRLCPAPICGGYFVHQANRDKTRCADGTLQAECHVNQVVFERPPPLPGVDISGVSLAHGRLVEIAAPPGGTYPQAQLLASAIWRAASSHAPDGTYYQIGELLKPGGGQYYQERELNVNTIVDAVAVDLGGVGASQSDLAEAQNLLVQGQLRAVGRNFAAGGIISGIIFAATQFYLPIYIP